jgi:hypothetical protein
MGGGGSWMVEVEVEVGSSDDLFPFLLHSILLFHSFLSMILACFRLRFWPRYYVDYDRSARFLESKKERAD